MPGRFREIRETNEDEIEDRIEVKESPEKRLKESREPPSLEWYAQFHDLIESIRQEIRENPPTPKEEEERRTRLAEVDRLVDSAFRKPSDLQEPEEQRERPSLEAYSRYDGFIKAVEQDLRENPLTQEEKQEIEENIEQAVRAAEALLRRHRIGENITSPVEKLVEDQPLDGRFQEQRSMSREPHSHYIREPTEQQGSDQSPTTMKVRENERKENIITEVSEVSYEIMERLLHMSTLQLTRLAEYRNKEAIQRLILQKPKLDAAIGMQDFERTRKNEPISTAYKGIIREYARYFLRERLQEDFQRYALTDSKSPILRAADNPELRKTLLPQPGSRLVDVSGDLLSLVKNTPNPA